MLQKSFPSGGRVTQPKASTFKIIDNELCETLVVFDKKEVLNQELLQSR